MELTNPLIIIAGAVGSLIISLLLTRWLLNNHATHLLDYPNARSLHQIPVPRTGGLAVLTGFFSINLIIALWWEPPPQVMWIAVALMLVAVISWLDDFKGISPLLRLTVHIFAAWIILTGGISWSILEMPGINLKLPDFLSAGLTMLFLVWMINLYNFMDGMDGLAGAMTLVGFTALAILGWGGRDLWFMLLAITSAAAAAGFLIFNFPPARIFLGDVGASSLGLLAGSLALWGSQIKLFPLWDGWLIFAPFLIDSTWTLFNRLWRGEKIWEAHRSHHYQRFVLTGWDHLKTLKYAVILMFSGAASAIGALRLTTYEQWLLLIAWIIIYGLINFKLTLLERKNLIN